MHLETWQTPNERRESLSQALPGAHIELLTDRFNAACYGREPSDPGLIARLEQGLDFERREARRHRLP